MPSSTLRYLFLLLASGWAILIYYLSSRAGTDVPQQFFGQDKLFHFIAFGILGFLGMGAMKTTSEGHRYRKAWLAIILVTLYGVLDEFHQHFVPGRVADLYDIIADMAGGIFGVWMMYFLLSKKRGVRSER